jgi:DNA-directed RNA polymerase subunit RPC12/RpoP
MAKQKSKRSWLESLMAPETEASPSEDKPEKVILQPALRQIGITDCPICKRTKNNRPFINCSFCSARIFYNGRESMRLLRKRMTSVEDE